MAYHELLALVEFEALIGTVQVSGLPGRWSLRPDGAPGARLELAPGETITLAGVTSGGVIDLEPSSMTPSGSHALDDRRSLVVFPDPGDGVTWVGLADETAPRLAAFRDVTSYPDDDRWRLPTSFTPASDAESVATIRRTRGGDERFAMPRAGWFTVTIEDQHYRLDVCRHGAVECYLNFRDATPGGESYGAGRFLPLPPSLEQMEVLDFNTAVVPPCSFSPLISCPLPPASNIIQAAVRAGQRDVVIRVAMMESVPALVNTIHR